MASRGMCECVIAHSMKARSHSRNTRISWRVHCKSSACDSAIDVTLFHAKSKPSPYAYCAPFFEGNAHTVPTRQDTDIPMNFDAGVAAWPRWRDELRQYWSDDYPRF